MFNINNLFVKGQQIANRAIALVYVFATLLVAIVAFYVFGFSVTWIAMLLENPATLHAPATFNGNNLFTSILAWQPAETMALWTLPIKLQGLIIVFLGAAGLYLTSYAGEYLGMLIKMYPFTRSRTGNTNSIGITFVNKWQPLINATQLMWNNVISAMRKVTLYIMFTMATITIIHFVWQILTTKCPM